MGDAVKLKRAKLSIFNYRYGLIYQTQVDNSLREKFIFQISSFWKNRDSTRELHFLIIEMMAKMSLFTKFRR